MSEERIITAETTTGASNDATLTTDGTTTNTVAQKPATATTLQQRITAATKAGGLKQLPEDFDAQTGDWKCITATEPFAVLYLDYKAAMLITPDTVSSHFTLLDKFWRDKKFIMNTGANRTSFKRKYSYPEGADNGDRIVDGSTGLVKTAYDKLSTQQGIERYYEEINNARLRNGADKLADSIRQMVMDGDATKDEIAFCLEQGLRYDLSENETAAILKNRFDQLNITPYGSTGGATLAEQLLSVNHWMTKAKQEEAERIRKDREALKIQILKGRYASTIEEIGTILFEDTAEAKEIIKEDLLKSVIGQKDIVLARDIAAITKNEKDVTLAFFKIVYKLNPALPYPFLDQQFPTAASLCTAIFESEQSLKQGKEEIKKGYIEAWLKETDKQAYNIFIHIRDSAENIDQATLTFIYTFCPQLPYRFAGKYLIKSAAELTAADRNIQNWEAAKHELFNGNILTWLSVSQKSTIPEQWNKVKEHFIEWPDIGLEYFLHLLITDLPKPALHVEPVHINYPKIQSGEIAQTNIGFTNTSRGYIAGDVQLSKNIPGVSLSASGFIINNVSGKNNDALQLTIDTAGLLKGVTYQTDIQIKTSDQQTLLLPVSFNIVFPRNAFIKQTALYAGIGALFFALIRFIVASKYPDWLGRSFNFFASWNTAVEYSWQLAIFGWMLLLFIAGLYCGIYFLIKYLKRK